MTRTLTEDDIAAYMVTLVTEHGPDTRSVRAAYLAATDDRTAGWLVFKDHEHKTVAQFNANLVVAVERIDP